MLDHSQQGSQQSQERSEDLVTEALAVATSEQVEVVDDLEEENDFGIGANNVVLCVLVVDDSDVQYAGEAVQAVRSRSTHLQHGEDGAEAIQFVHTSLVTDYDCSPGMTGATD